MKKILLVAVLTLSLLLTGCEQGNDTPEELVEEFFERYIDGLIEGSGDTEKFCTDLFIVEMYENCMETFDFSEEDEALAEVESSFSNYELRELTDEEEQQSGMNAYLEYELYILTVDSQFLITYNDGETETDGTTQQFLIAKIDGLYFIVWPFYF